jgi:hypothetical protein
MHLKFYYSSSVDPSDSPANEGSDKVLELIEKIEGKGATCERIDTSQLTEEQIAEAYIRSVIGPTQLKKYKVRQVFGSARHSGWLFGKQVPALVIYSSSESHVPEDVLPHSIGGHIVTIREYLEKATR